MVNRNNVLGDGTVSFEYDEDNEKGILTLNNANLASEDTYPIKASDMDNLEIMLVGENTIKSNWYTGIMAVNLTFSGTGSIDIITEGPYNWPVECGEGAVTVNSGDVKISGVNYALCLDGALTVNGGTLELIASDDGDAKALDVWDDPNVVLSDDRIMITGSNPDGSDADITDVSETDRIAAAKYIKIFNKYVPITYNPGEFGTESISTMNKTYGEEFTLSDAIFTRSGYRQTGWATTDGGDKAYELGGTYTGNEPLTLYPVWERAASPVVVRPVQKPEIIIDTDKGDFELSSRGTIATIKPKDGYEIDKITVNDKEITAIDNKITGLKTGDKVVITLKEIITPEYINEYVKELKLIARSSKTTKGNILIKVTSLTDADGNPANLDKFKDEGYTVKYKYYRSTKKSSEYDERLEKDYNINSYINTTGKKGTRYYYRVKVMVYDADGNFIAKSDLKQCKYAARIWSK